MIGQSDYFVTLLVVATITKSCLSWFHESHCRTILTVFWGVRLSKRIFFTLSRDFKTKTMTIQTRFWQNEKKMCREFAVMFR